MKINCKGADETPGGIAQASGGRAGHGQPAGKGVPGKAGNGGTSRTVSCATDGLRMHPATL